MRGVGGFSGDISRRGGRIGNVRAALFSARDVEWDGKEAGLQGVVESVGMRFFGGPKGWDQGFEV